MKKSKTPLAERMRPGGLNELLGQEHIMGLLKRLVEKRDIPSLILWGPAGSGKTTLAHIIARETRARLIPFSAVLIGVNEIRKAFRDSERLFEIDGRETILFLDEIHRFNKAQQDAFLHHIEDGRIILIGATTENPSFSLNTPLLSRCAVLTLKALSENDLKKIIMRALKDRERGLGGLDIDITIEALNFLAAYSNGDARCALNTLEVAATIMSPDEKGRLRLTVEIAEEAMQKRALIYDRGGDEHYNVISAFIKSMRGSDPDAALYWLARMLEAGEDPLFIVRRMVIFASEDIGNADPMALRLAIAVKEAIEFIGMPEGWIPLAHAVTYLSSSPKSNASYLAYQAAVDDVRKEGALPVPLHIRNAPTGLMKKLGYGKGYKYPHNFRDSLVKQDYMPERLKGRRYFRPKEAGFEGEIKRRMEKIRGNNNQ